jgi:sulfoxide reductase catalytic subunit YedY
MLIKPSLKILSSDITDENVYTNRRQFMRRSGSIALASMAGGLLPATSLACQSESDLPDNPASAMLPDELTPWEAVTGYNNFYEFGTGKEDPARNATEFVTSPWEVKVSGEVEDERTWDFEELVNGLVVEERVYRMRCVEGWSMVIPWNGFPLASLIERLKPSSKAKFIEFKTLHDEDRMPGQRRRVLNWPYVEALRMDEAMHPLTLMVTGVYGKTLPPQNGAPIRLVVPWKYGFKGIKSIVSIRFTEKQPMNTWRESIPGEYGFYANVNPQVDHPRWTQATERRIGEFRRRDTLMFNGYADEVESLYAGLDLRKNY